MTTSTNVRLERTPWWGPRSTAVWRIYREAFPAHERVHPALLRLCSLRPDIDLLVAVDENGEVAGMLMTMRRKVGVYALFLAVSSSLRGRGYGSAVLEAMRDYYPDQGVVLAIESVDSRFDNYDERVRRLKFYQRNGFQDSGWRVWESSGVYDLLCRDMDVNIDDYRYAMGVLEPLSPFIEALRVPVSEPA